MHNFPRIVSLVLRLRLCLNLVLPHTPAKVTDTVTLEAAEPTRKAANAQCVELGSQVYVNAREALPAAVVCVVLLPAALRVPGPDAAAGIQPGRASPQLSQQQPVRSKARGQQQQQQQQQQQKQWSRR